MSSPLSVRLSGRVERAQARIRNLQDGKHTDADLVPTAAAASAALELTRSHPELIAHCGIFPTPREGLLFEGNAWLMHFEIEIDRHGKMAGSLFGPDDMFLGDLPLAEMVTGLDQVATLPRKEWEVLVDFEGPQVLEIEAPDGTAFAVAGADGPDGHPDPEFLVVMPTANNLAAFYGDLICTRALMMDPANRLFTGRLLGEELELQPFHGDVEERMLPAEGLMFEDLRQAAAKPVPAKVECGA